MVSDLAIPSDKRKFTTVFRDELDKQASAANPQSFVYFAFLYTMVDVITILLGPVRLFLQHNPSLVKAHGGVFLIMTIVSGSMAVLASGILILASFLLQSWMKDIHYTILKTIGSFSAIVLPFSLGALAFVPSGHLNWIAYTVLCLIFVGLLCLYSFVWKVSCAHHQEEQFNTNYPVHWTLFLLILVPLFIVLLPFFSSNFWLNIICGGIPIIVLLFIAFMLQQRITSLQQHPQQADKTIDIV